MIDGPASGAGGRRRLWPRSRTSANSPWLGSWLGRRRRQPLRLAGPEAGAGLPLVFSVVLVSAQALVLLLMCCRCCIGTPCPPHVHCVLVLDSTAPRVHSSHLPLSQFSTLLEPLPLLTAAPPSASPTSITQPDTHAPACPLGMYPRSPPEARR